MADLMSLSVSVTTKATLIGFGYTLYRFEAKKKGYKFSEDHSIQFIVYLGQSYRLQNKNFTVRLVNSTTFN